MKHIVLMKRKVTPKKYREAFCLRLKAIREAAGYSQDEFANELDISRETYSKYEYRSLLPHYLIASVCEITRHDPWYVLTGKAAATSPVSKIAQKAE